MWVVVSFLHPLCCRYGFLVWGSVLMEPAFSFALYQLDLSGVVPLNISGVSSRLVCTSIALPTFGRTQTRLWVSAASTLFASRWGWGHRKEWWCQEPGGTLLPSSVSFRIQDSFFFSTSFRGQDFRYHPHAACSSFLSLFSSVKVYRWLNLGLRNSKEQWWKGRHPPAWDYKASCSGSACRQF